MAALELDDIQGFLLFAYASLPEAVYLHVFFPESATPNAWLADLAPRVAASNRSTGRRGDKTNVAFTSAGLARLGLEERELETFPRELQQGMGHALRAHVLGDVHANAPEHWEVGGPKTKAVHALVLLFARDDDAIAQLREGEAARIAEHGGEIVHEDHARVTEREHFGFVDGVEQPHVAGSPRRRPAHHAEVPAGEFILGYPNAYGESPPSPRGRDDFDLGKNGTYLVYRKLAQDVAAFWGSMFAEAERRAGGHEREENLLAVKLASQIVGRWPSGAPLVHHPERDVGDAAYRKDFLFHEADPAGIACPLGAHIRRANPRDMLEPGPEESRKATERHRLLRRGRSYGPPAARALRDRTTPDGQARGLVFVVLNASIRRQFEFVQQTWLNNPKFAGLYDERDPLAATIHEDDKAHFTMQGRPVRCRMQGLPRFVTTKGGGYFFMPGKRALAWLATLAPVRAPLPRGAG